MLIFVNRLLSKWRGQSDGATAIEFSLLAIPYLTLVLGVIELALMYTSAALLEGATGNASRLLKTGQIQQISGGDPETVFRDSMCDFITALVDCDDIQIEVQTIDDFGGFDTVAAQFDADGNLDSRGFDAGGSSDRVVVRTAYRYSMMTPLVGELLTGGQGSRLFLSTNIFQTEPYEFEGFDDGTI